MQLENEQLVPYNLSVINFSRFGESTIDKDMSSSRLSMNLL